MNSVKRNLSEVFHCIFLVVFIMFGFITIVGTGGGGGDGGGGGSSGNPVSGDGGGGNGSSELPDSTPIHVDSFGRNSYHSNQ